MKLGVMVGTYRISLGMPLDETAFAYGGTTRLGLFYKAMMPGKQRGDIIYLDKNCPITCFSGAAFATASIDPSLRTDEMNGTSAFLYYNNGRLRYAVLQVVDNAAAAIAFTERFRVAAVSELGNPERLDVTTIKYKFLGMKTDHHTHRKFVWRDGTELLISELSQSGKNAFIHWKVVCT